MLNDMITQVMKADTKTSPECDFIIKRLHLYYGVKLVTFGIDDNSDLIIQFPAFVQPYRQSPPTVYQIEVVPSPIID